MPKGPQGQKRPADVIGNAMDHVSTSFVERQNLTMRMQMRRFTRLTNAFSKKLDNHVNAIALYFVFYNFCRIHKSLRVTPAMEAGITDRVWSFDNVIAKIDEMAPPPGEARTLQEARLKTGNAVTHSALTNW